SARTGLGPLMRGLPSSLWSLALPALLSPGPRGPRPVMLVLASARTGPAGLVRQVAAVPDPDAVAGLALAGQEGRDRTAQGREVLVRSENHRVGLPRPKVFGGHGPHVVVDVGSQAR